MRDTKISDLTLDSMSRGGLLEDLMIKICNFYLTLITQFTHRCFSVRKH